jgi:hypothetical protein
MGNINDHIGAIRCMLGIIIQVQCTITPEARKAILKLLHLEIERQHSNKKTETAKLLNEIAVLVDHDGGRDLTRSSH